MNIIRAIIRSLSVVLSLVIAATAATSTCHAQQVPPPGTYVWGQMDDENDQVIVGGLGSEQAGQNAPLTYGGTVITQIAFAPACEGNHPDNTGAAYSLCAGAQTICAPGANGDPQILMWRWTRQWDLATDTALTEWEMQTPVCVGWDEIEVPSIPLLVMQEFEERAKLLQATVHIQPPGGRTLVNFDTIFYADDRSTTYTGIPIAGASVDLQISADTYTWHFGDGATAMTTMPGRPYPNKDVTHRYDGIQTISPRVDVIYTGRYRVDGGTWLDIPGTATVAGPEAVLTVIAARSELIFG